jgi:hypothetical protein
MIANPEIKTWTVFQDSSLKPTQSKALFEIQDLENKEPSNPSRALKGGRSWQQQ